MKEIVLKNGFKSIVDDEDFEILNQFEWRHEKHGRTYRAIRGYRNSKISNNWINILMHREIVYCPDGMIIDHIDGDGLNNQKSNLRICTQSQNIRNRPKQLNCASQYKGVSFYTRRGKIKTVSRITINGVTIHLGLFDNEIDAAITYDNAAKKYHGEFARINFPLSLAP